MAVDRAEQNVASDYLHRCATRESDHNDAVGIARIMQCGRYREIRVKSLDSHAIKAVLVSRSLLVKIKRHLESQVRGLLKNLSLVIGRTKMNAFVVRAAELLEARPELVAAVDTLLKARETVDKQIADLDRKMMRLARNGVQVRRFMTAPGIGPITALCYLATVDDPMRFKRSRSVGAYFSLTSRRYASGQVSQFDKQLFFRLIRRFHERTSIIANHKACPRADEEPASAERIPSALTAGALPLRSFDAFYFEAGTAGRPQCTARKYRNVCLESGMRRTTDVDDGRGGAY